MGLRKCRNDTPHVPRQVRAKTTKRRRGLWKSWPSIKKTRKNRKKNRRQVAWMRCFVKLASLALFLKFSSVLCSGSSASESMDPDSLSQDEEARLEVAITVLRITQKELRLDHTRMSDLSTTQLGLVTSLLAPSFGVREVMDMGGDLVPSLRCFFIARIGMFCWGYVCPCSTALENSS